MAPADSSYHHIGMRVNDLERAIEWYAEALGFALEGTPHELAVAKVRVCFMVNPAGERVELFEFSQGEPTPRWEHPDAALSRGYSHLGIRVDDIEASFERAAAAGARVLWPPKMAPPLGTRTSYLADPDNNLIEFVEATDPG
jgi:glyoxylase I family protein